jgi:hypothetical protein
MNTMPLQSVRRRGKEIAMPELRRKIGLLLDGRTPRNGAMRPVFNKQSIIAQGMGLDPSELSKAMAHDRLSTIRVAAFLRLFKLDVADWIVPQTSEDRHWLELAQEPLDAFCARVRLAGGDDYTGRAGDTWDRFMADLKSTGRCTPKDAGAFMIDARDPQDWLHPTPGAHGQRMGPRSDPLAEVRHDPGLPLVRAGQWARVYLNVMHALRERHVMQAGAYIFIFQDVLIDRTRHIAPLVPFPPDCAVTMPGERVHGIAEGGDPLVQVPLPSGQEQFLEIYSNWGLKRSLVAVVSDRPLDEEVLLDSRSQRQICLERLDLLAARLVDPQRFPAGSYVVWKLEYAVEPRP